MRCILLLSILHIWSLNIQAQRDFRVMFYNVENLFDTKDNPDTNDDNFLPEGNQRWTHYRYWKKLHDISKVITMVGEGNPPAIVGLCEVENDSVLFDLTKRAALNRHKYNYVITHSDDPRGMNVALLYQRDDMKLLTSVEYAPSFRSRSILHVIGKIVNGDTLDIFVCHLHSRVDGIKRTRPYRIESASIIKQRVDSLLNIRKQANIIIMGDFNDYPNDSSLNVALDARIIDYPTSKGQLYNLFRTNVNTNKNSLEIGSYKYRGKWNFIDQLIVNGNLLEPKSKIRVKANKAYIFASDFLLQEDAKGGFKPFRTYSGYKYMGGYSDHLPVYFDLVIE